VVNTQEVAHTFGLRNAGDAPVTISRIHSGCGCTRTQVSAMTLPPGGTGTVDVIFHLRGRKGERVINLFVHSDDPANPILALRCRGQTYFDEADRVMDGEAPPDRGGPEGRMTADRPRAQTGAGASAAPASPVEAPPPAAGITVIPPEVRLKETAGRIPVRYVMLRSAGQRPFQVLSCASEPEGGASWVGVHQTGAGWTTLRVGPIVDPPDWTAATIRVTTDLPGFETIPIRVWLQR